MNTDNLLAAIQGLGPRGPWFGLDNILCTIVIAEDEITKAQARHPGGGEIIWQDSFLLLHPSAYVRSAPEIVYRAHCAEILDRLAFGLDTTLGTKAEIMMVLSETSLKVPLTHTAVVLYARLFSKILPDAPIIYDLETLGTMDFDQTVGTFLAEISKKCRDPDRKPARKGR